MAWSWIRSRMVVAAVTSVPVTMVLLGFSGCGGSGMGSGDSVVVPEPGVSIPTTTGSATNAPAGAGSATPTSPTAAATPTAPAVPATSAGGWGTLKGQVVFGGAPPSPMVLEEKGKAVKDPQYCAKDAPILSERLVVDAATKGVKNVLVYVPKPSAVNEEAKSAKSQTQVVFDQNKCVFEPHVLGVLAGSKIEIKSSDDVNHNVNARLKNNGTFNKLLAGHQTLPDGYVPAAGERSPLPVNCDIHPWMQAWWLVLDSPYFAVTDEKGNYEIKNLPAGAQKVVFWQEATGFVTAPSGDEVAITAGVPVDKNVTIDPAKVKPAR